MIAIEDGGYESASDYDEETLALITREEHGGDDSDHETQYMAPEDADRYECLVAQRVLSVQVTQAEQNQRHNLFHTKGVVNERSDVGSNPRRPIFHERSGSLRRTRRTQEGNEGKHERNTQPTRNRSHIC